MPNGPEIMVNDTLCRARVKAHEQRIERAEERLERHEETLVGVSECLAKLTALYEVSTTELTEARAQIHEIEMKPNNLWEKILTGALSGGGGAVIGAMLMKLLIG